MSAYPIVFETATGKICRKGINNYVVYKDGTFTIDERSTNPKVMLQWSDDGGFTWSNEYWRSAGRIGEYQTSVTFTRLGMSTDRVFRVTVVDPVKWILIDARIDVQKEK